MKKVFIAIFMFLPMWVSAQNVLTQEEKDLQQAKEKLVEAQKALDAAKAKANEAAKKRQAQQNEARKQELLEQKRIIEEQIKAAEEATAQLEATADELNAETERNEKQAAREKKQAVRDEKQAAREKKQTQKNEAVTLPAKEADRKPVVTDEPKNEAAETKTYMQNSDGSNWVYSISSDEDKNEQKVQKQEVKKLANGAELKDDPKYLEGAVTQDKDGDVVFEKSISTNGKNPALLFASLKSYLKLQTKGGENNIDSRIIDITNDKEQKYIVIGDVDEWIVFNSSFISLDRTECKYRFWINITNQKVDLKMENIRYKYEEGRNTGFSEPAKNVIIDKYALNKKKNKLARIYGKFRKGTIDRKDQLFNGIEELVNQ